MKTRYNATKNTKLSSAGKTWEQIKIAQDIKFAEERLVVAILLSEQTGTITIY